MQASTNGNVLEEFEITMDICGFWKHPGREE